MTGWQVLVLTGSVSASMVVVWLTFGLALLLYERFLEQLEQHRYNKFVDEMWTLHEEGQTEREMSVKLDAARIERGEGGE